MTSSVRASIRDNRRRQRNRKALADFKARAGPPPDYHFWESPAYQLGKSTDLKQPYKEHPWVYRAATVVAQNLASVPFRLYSGDPENPQELQGTDWNKLFANPNPEMTSRQFWTQAWLHLLTMGGESFWWLKGNAGELAERTVPRWMWPYPGKHFEEKVSKTGVLEGWRLNLGSGQVEELELYQVVQIRLEDPYNPRRGMSPYDAAERSVRTDVKAHEWNEAGLDNGARPGGVLQGKDSSVNLSDEQINQIRRQFDDRYAGATKNGRTLVIPGGLQWQQASMTPKDLEFQGQREWSRQEISSVYGVPQFLLGILGDVHRETSREARKLFWEETLVPLLRVAQDILRARLFMGRGENERDPTAMPTVWGAFDLSGVKALQVDETERVQQASVLWGHGVSLEELNRRFELGLEEQEGWDVSFVPLGVEPMEQAMKEPEPMPAAFGGPPPGDGEEEDDEEEEEDRGLVVPAKRGEVSRRVLWEQYIRGIQEPGEKRMQARVLRWMATVRKAVLRWVEGGGRSVRELTEGEVDAFLAAHADAWTRDLIELTAPVTEWIVGASLDRLEAQIGSLSHASMTHPAILDFLDRQALRKSVIADTLKTQIRLTLIEGLAEGQSVGASAAEIRPLLMDEFNGVMRSARTRALTIARTESGSASTGSRFAAYKAEGVQKHSWLTAGDGNERESHAAQDGVVRVVGEAFPNGLLYPLDERGPPGEVINCRCDTLPE